jgi:hypothetical protein
LNGVAIVEWKLVDDDCLMNEDVNGNFGLEEIRVIGFSPSQAPTSALSNFRLYGFSPSKPYNSIMNVNLFSTQC